MSNAVQDPPEPGSLAPPAEAALPASPIVDPIASTAPAVVPAPAAAEAAPDVALSPPRAEPAAALPAAAPVLEEQPPAPRPTDEILAEVAAAQAAGTLATAVRPPAPAPVQTTTVVVEPPRPEVVGVSAQDVGNAVPPPPAAQGNHPFAREEDRGLDPFSLLPIVLAVLALVVGVWKCSRGDEAPVAHSEEPASTELDSAVVEDAPPRARIPELPGRAPSQEEPRGAIPAPPIGEYDGPPLAPGQSANKDAEALARQAEEHYRASRLDAALQSVEAAMGKTGDVSRYEALRGLILHAQHRDREALDQFNKAVHHDARNAELYRQRATVNVALGRHAHASRDVRAYDRLKAGTSPTQPP